MEVSVDRGVECGAKWWLGRWRTVDCIGWKSWPDVGRFLGCGASWGLDVDPTHGAMRLEGLACCELVNRHDMNREAARRGPEWWPDVDCIVARIMARCGQS